MCLDTVVELTPQQEAELVQRAADGDGDALGLLTVRYYRPLGSYLLKRIRQPDAVEDLVQESFLAAYSSIKDGCRPDRFSAWLFGIAHHVSGAWLRRRHILPMGRTPPPEEIPEQGDGPTLEDVEEQVRLERRLKEELADLPEDVQTMLQMKHGQGRTCQQIADETGQPVGTVKSQLSRTYKTLRDRLRDNEG